MNTKTQCLLIIIIGVSVLGLMLYIFNPPGTYIEKLQVTNISPTYTRDFKTFCFVTFNNNTNKLAVINNVENPFKLHQTYLVEITNKSSYTGPLEYWPSGYGIDGDGNRGIVSITPFEG